MSKTALITGSSKGLGKELAFVFAEKGYDIILHGRDKKNLKKTKERISTFGVDSEIVEGDLTNYQTIHNLSEKAKEKDISLLINNAAIICPSLSFEEFKDKDFVEMTLVNLVAPINLSKRVYDLFLKKGEGNIININSLAGLEPKKPRTLYCATKYGLRGFSDSLRLEARDKNINIMSVYLSKIKGNADEPFGMDPKLVSDEIYNSFSKGGIEELIIDARPEEYKKSEKIKRLVINGKKFEL